MLDYEVWSAHESAATSSLRDIAAPLRPQLAHGVRVGELMKTHQMLTAVNCSLLSARDRPQPAAVVEALEQVSARVAAATAQPPRCDIEGADIVGRYRDGLGWLIRAYGATEALLDEETLAKIGWVTQQIRLEYARARLLFPENAMPDATR